MPDQFNLVLNTSHPYIQDLVNKMTSEEVEEVPEVKEGEEPKPAVKKTVWTLAGQDERLHQLIDIALLASGRLKGEA